MHEGLKNKDSRVIRSETVIQVLCRLNLVFKEFKEFLLPQNARFKFIWAHPIETFAVQFTDFFIICEHERIDCLSCFVLRVMI